MFKFIVAFGAIVNAVFALYLEIFIEDTLSAIWHLLLSTYCTIIFYHTED